jgi:hypothetical protein
MQVSDGFSSKLKKFLEIIFISPKVKSEAAGVFSSI